MEEIEEEIKWKVIAGTEINDEKLAANSAGYGKNIIYGLKNL